MSLYMFVVLALATWRITHLIVEDTMPVVAKPRAWVTARWPDSNFAYLIGCTYCASVWVAAGVVAVVDLAMDVSAPAPVLLAASLSILAALGETVVDWLDRFGAS